MKYFAYAYNLNEKNLCRRIKRRIPAIPVVLQDYKILFNIRSKYNNKSFANIEYSPGDIVFGALYELSKNEFDVLDEYEDVALGTYERRKVKVFDGEKLINAWTYIGTNDEWLSEHLTPMEDYINTITECITTHFMLK